MNSLLESIAATLLILPSLFGITPTPEPTPTPTSSPEQVESQEPASTSIKPRPTPTEEALSSAPAPEPVEPTPAPTPTEPEPSHTHEETQETYVEPTPTPTPTPTETAPEQDYDNKWDQVAQCESNGDWSANTGNKFYGGVQFSMSSWHAVDGTDFASAPHLATKQEQIIAAERLEDAQGMGAWPVCGKPFR